MVPIKTFLSRNHLWRQFRNVQAEGIYRASDRLRLWSRILDTAAVETNKATTSTPAEVHILTYQRDYLSAIWALKSFYHYSGARYPLAIHLQGRENQRMIARLRAHFPQARLLTQAEADARIEPWLHQRGYARLSAARRQNIMIMKLVDFIVMCQARHMLAIDSDVVFFRRPDELLLKAEDKLDSDLYMHDGASSYNISETKAWDELRIKLAPRVNCGVMLLPRDEKRLARCEEYLAHEDVARSGGLIEQTMHALYASETARVGYLPDTYYVSADATRISISELVCRHYAGPSRHLLTEEGMPRLIEMGLLNELRSS